MNPFRDKTPKHRAKRKKCKHYTSYKTTLRIDFLKRCGYCNDLHIDYKRYYVIDHFVPQNPSDFSHNIPPNNYYNLVYACCFCNGKKSNTWPTKDARIHNDGKKGFVMPTKNAYGNLFERDNNGFIKVKSNSKLGKYIFEQLHLGWHLHALIWKFEKILNQEKILEKIQDKDTTIREEIRELRDIRLTTVDEINAILSE